MYNRFNEESRRKKSLFSFWVFFLLLFIFSILTTIALFFSRTNFILGRISSRGFFNFSKYIQQQNNVDEPLMLWWTCFYTFSIKIENFQILETNWTKFWVWTIAKICYWKILNDIIYLLVTLIYLFIQPYYIFSFKHNIWMKRKKKRNNEFNNM